MDHGGTVNSLASTFLALIGRQVEVRRTEVVGDRFRIITLAGAALEDRAWTRGSMIQLAFSAFAARAYTPFWFAPERGTLDFLGYVHGNGIGSSYLTSVEEGAHHFIAGPRAGIALDALTYPVVFFGDETSISTAAAFARRDTTCFFEVNSIADARIALDRLGVTGRLIQREDGDRHLDAIEPELLAEMRGAHGVLTGKASTIQRLYRTLKRAGVPKQQITNMAYWAPGRKGFSGLQR